MKIKRKVATLDRREFIASVGAAVAAISVSDIAMAQDAKPSLYDEALAKIAKGAKPVEGKVTVEMPEIAENGNTVPFQVIVESPMTEKDYVKTLHVFSTGNPQPVVGTFHFSPISGKASVSGRMRLAKTQDVVCVAETSDGKLFMGKRTVKVTIGGCGG